MLTVVCESIQTCGSCSKNNSQYSVHSQVLAFRRLFDTFSWGQLRRLFCRTTDQRPAQDYNLLTNRTQYGCFFHGLEGLVRRNSCDFETLLQISRWVVNAVKGSKASIMTLQSLRKPLRKTRIWNTRWTEPRTEVQVRQTYKNRNR